MLCQECKKNNAVYFYSENINGKTTSVALCEECRKKHTEYNKFDSLHSFEDILFPTSLMFGPSIFGGSKNYKQIEKRCDACNASLRDLTSGKRNFCPDCYNKFHDDLSEFLSNLHGSDTHKGRSPSSVTKSNNIDLPTSSQERNTSELKNNDHISELKKELSIAISEERYEDAAKLRDKIKEAETEAN